MQGGVRPSRMSKNRVGRRKRREGADTGGGYVGEKSGGKYTT